MPIKNDREYRSLKLEAEKENEFHVTGYATTFDSPYELYRDKDFVMLEQVDHDAFKDTDMRDVIMQYDHTGRVYARTSNGSLDLKTDEHGLKVNADLSLTTGSRQLHEDIAAGLINKMSFAFTVAEDEYLEENKDDITIVTRTIKRIGKLFDVSAVSLPANDQTVISARNLSDGVISEIRAERLKAQEIKEARARLALRLKIGGFEDGNQRDEH